jgi:tetratricopeptide (TPR) repeat protein
MGPISQGNKANSRPRIPSKTKEALDIESSSIKLLRKTQKSCFQNTGNASSPRSVSQLNGDRDRISKDENSSTITLGSPRSSRGFPVKSITKYTNQACEAFESRQYNLAMRLFQDAHNLLHDYRNRRANRDGSKVVSSAVQTRQRNIESPYVSDVDFLPTNSYIYQRLDFDEGMCTYSEPMKIFDDRSCTTNEITMNALIWYNKGHMYCRCNMWDTAICCFQSALDEKAHDESEDIQSGQIHVAALQSLAQIQYRLGKFKESIALYKRAISYAKTIYGEVHESIGAALNSLSVLCYHLMTSGGKNVDNAKKSDEYLKYAKKYSKRSLEIRIQTLGFNHKDVGTTYNNIGRLHVMQGQFKEALECYEKALSIRAKTLTKRSLDYAATAFNAGQSYHHIHELSKALKYYREFLSVAVKRFTKNHRDVAVVLSGIAEIHQERGEMEEALKLYEESLEAGRNALGEDHPEVAMILNRLGNFHFVMENFDAAYDVYEQGLKIEKGHHDDANGIVSLCNLGEIHRQRKEWSAAVKVFRAVLKIQRKKFGNHVQNSEIATTLNVIGLTYDKKGDTHTALRYLQEALLMRRISLGERHIDVAPTLTTIGIILYRSNKFTIAMDLLNEALGIRLSVLGRDHRDIAFTMYNIALIHQKQGSLAEAIKCLLEVLRIEEKVFGSEHKDVAITLFKLGETFKRQNDLERALYYYEKALKVERKLMEDNDLLTVARTLTEIGNIHLSRGQRVEMMNAFNEAARIYQCCSMSPRDVAVATNLYAIDLVCPRGAPAA